MKKCSRCGKPKTDHVIVDGKVECFDCINEDRKKVKKVMSHHRPKIISCTICDKTYDINLRKCPDCGHHNPLHDFHFGEFFINVSLGYLAILIPVIIAFSVARGVDYMFALFLTPWVVLVVFVYAFVLGGLFFIGRFIRDTFIKH